MAPAKFLTRVQNEKGFAFIFLAIMMLVLLGVCAFAVDVGYMYVVKRQLQNAADAGALAGVGNLIQSPSPTIRWDLAQSNATLFVTQNKAAGAYLTGSQVVAGYWNINQKPSDTPVIQSQAMLPTANDLPAVEVTVSKSPGNAPENNGGPLPLFFAKILGFQTATISATAVAAMAPAGTMTGDVLPITISQSYANAYPIINGQSSQFTISPDLDVTNDQWFGLNMGTGTNASKNYLNDPSHTLPTPISVGTQIQKDSSGDKTKIYDYINNNKGTIMYMPVVDNFSSNTIVAFIAFYIVSAQGGSTKTVTGYFVGPVLTKFAGGSGGKNYGTYSITLVN